MNPADFHETLEEFYTVFIKINNLYSAFAKQKGMSYHALFVLYSIYHSEEGCSPSDICDKWLIPKQTVTSVLRTFDENGFVCYRTSDQDRRNKILSLSEKGTAYAKPILEDLYRLETAVFEKMGLSLVQQLVEGNRAFQKNMEEVLNHNGN